MDMSHCHVQYSCLRSYICDILHPVGSHSVIHSQVFARFPHVSFKCLLGLSFLKPKNIFLLSTEGEAVFCCSPINP